MQATILAPLVIAVVLITSGIAKLLDPKGTGEAFVELKVPQWARSTIIVKAFPMAEVALGVALLVVPSWGGIVIAMLALALFVTYLVLIANVVGRGREANCNCFGSLTSGEVNKRTLWRNIALVAVALLVVVDIGFHRTPALYRMFSMEAVGWILGAGGVALVTALIVGGASTQPASDAEELDYIRQPIPYAALRDADGNLRHLHSLVVERPAVLLMATAGCGACVATTQSLANWRKRLPQLDFYLVGNRDALVARWPEESRWALHDEHNYVAGLFGGSFPQAVLLGADGLLAGGPVAGAPAINDLIDEIELQLVESMAASEEHAP